MNLLILIAAGIALLTTLGHFLIGTRQFLNPMLEAPIDPVAKKQMHCIFHFVSVYFILSTITLLLIGTGLVTGAGAVALTRFIALNYALFAIWQIALARSSKITLGLLKLFQWIFFLLITLLTWIGTFNLSN